MALVAAGRLATLQGDHVRARTLYDEGLPLAREGDERWVLWAALTNIGLDEQDQGKYEPAKRHFTEALVTARRAAYPASQAISLNNLATLAYWQVDIAEARARGEEAARLARSVGDIWVTAFALCTVGYVALWQHDLAAARRVLPESLVLFRGAGERWGTAIALEALGHLATAEHDYKGAKDQFVESLLIRKLLGDRQGIAASLEALASLAARQGQQERALVLAGAAEWLRETTGGPLSPVGRRLLERWLVPLQQAYHDDETASAWAQGRALGDEQAVVVALGDLNVDSAGAHAHEVQHAPADNAMLLSRREQQVAKLVGSGLTNRQIATELVVAERTVGAHIEHILDKLSVSSRTQIGVWAARHGLLESSLV